VKGNASGYERELKQILQADPESLERYAKSLPPASRPALAVWSGSPFLEVRAAGSLGFDLVALRNEFAFPIEVKASHADTIHFTAASGRAAEQLEAHKESVHRVGLLVVYAFRRVGVRSEDPWRLFGVGQDGGRGRLGLVRRRLPSLDTTREGNAVLRWHDGLPLHEFLDLVGALITPPVGA
jgi:hypothetical protein